MECSHVLFEGRHVEARTRPGGFGLAALLSLAVVVWEYLLNATMNPADWNLAGVGAHMALDVAILLPVVALALAGGLRLARRFRMETGEWASLLGVAGLACLLLLAAMIPVVAYRDVVHEWMGNTYGLSLAQVQVDQVRTDLTVKESKQLCSFTSLRNPSLAGEDLTLPLLFRLETGASSLLSQLAAFLPLLVAGLYLRLRTRLPRPDFREALALARWLTRPLRLGSLATLALLAFCFGNGMGATEASVVAPGGTAYDACQDGGPVKVYDVHAINVVHTLNRYFDYAPGFMYALEDNIPAIRAFEGALNASRARVKAQRNVNLIEEDMTRVTPGLRQDPIQPLVIRANLGDCVRINFTNGITGDSFPASLHILGLAHRVVGQPKGNAGGAVGQNPISYVNPGGSITYEISVPKDPAAERAYFFSDHGAGTSPLNVGARTHFRVRQGLGLFGALVIEPEGATYLDVETGEQLDTQTGSTWEAIIIDPNDEGRPDGKSFREFVLLYHELGHENFRAIFDWDDVILPHLDGAQSGVYRIGARALNYRSEPFRRRMELSDLVNGTGDGTFRQGKSLGYSSYPFGDPPTPIPRSYLGEATKTRILHGGAEVFHVHHLHGGGDRWRRNPDADPNSNFWKGLTKVPNPNTKSVHLDSQSIGPGSSYNLEHECGAGGCQQGEGEFLYHCHIGHHYIAGMWGFWRVFATKQTAANELHGHPLYVESRLFQADNVFSNSQAPSNTPPLPGVPAGQLIGVKVDWNRTIVADNAFSNPLTQVKLSEWIKDQLPPQGVRLDNNDATMWDWNSTGANATLQIWGEPEETRDMANWTSPNPGDRPEVRFNPKNGRYAWPLFRPHAGARPPFTPRHSGSPWLGEQMIPGRMDGLCANNLVHPNVFVGLKAQRFYPISSITLPIQVTRAVAAESPDATHTDEDGMLFVLNEHKDDVKNGIRPKEPLAIRSNVGDCVEVIFTNEIPDGPLNRQFSKVNMHSHFVQFDTQGSDGVVTGFSYEQAVRPYENEQRTLTQPANQFSNTLKVTNVERLRPGVWIGIGLGEGTCGSLFGQPLPCTEVRKITEIIGTDTLKLDLPLLGNHGVGEAVGVEFVRYNWYSDVDFGTVFFHTHTETKDWDHGLFGAHIVEPKGSTYHDPVTGAEIRAGNIADIHVHPTLLGKPVADGVSGSFREFMLFLHNQNPVVGQFELGGGTINLRAEPWSIRPGNPAYRFSSVTHGDPFTPEVRAYVGDPVVFRGLGLVEKVGGIRVTGHRFNIERNNKDSDLRDTTFIGISERYDFALDGGAGGPKGYPGDYMYYSTLSKDFESGAWGLLRVYDSPQGDLKPLPGRSLPSGGSGFPQQSAGSGDPTSLADGPGNACPPGTPVKSYNLAISDTTIIYNDALAGDPASVAYFEDTGASTFPNTRAPMIVRVAKGECLRVNLRNLRSQRSGFSVGELLFDPQRSYGAAIGLNYDSTVAGGATRTYEYYADKELGLTLAFNFGDPDSFAKGGWGGVVVEPAGSTFHAPGGGALPGGGIGIQADIVKNGAAKREFVALFMDHEIRLSDDTMPYPDDPELTTSINYTTEPLPLRNFLLAPADVFRTDLWNDPRHVVSVPAGAATIYRVGQPWGEMPHAPTVEGHRYVQEPGMPGSEVLINDVLAPGMTLNMELVGGAGGDLQLEGDYLFHDRSQPFVQTGMWNLMRVVPPTSASALAASDSITVTSVESSGSRTTLSGVVSTKPAGDTVGRIAVFDGVAANGRCTGKRLGFAQVDRGSGRWQLDLGTQAPQQLCLRSPGGGVASGPTLNMVTEQTRRVNALAEQMRREQQLEQQLQRQFDELERMEEEQ